MPEKSRARREQVRDSVSNLRSPTSAGATSVPSTPVSHRQSTSATVFDFPEQGRDDDSVNSSECENELPVNFDPLLLEPPTASPRRRRGRPPKRGDNTKSKRSGAKEPSQIPTPRVEKASTGRGDARRVKLTQKHQQQIEARMGQLLSEFNSRPWPNKKRRGVSAERTKNRCRGDCTCSSFAQCQQNAHSYIKAAKYMAESEVVSHNIPMLKGGKVTQRCHTKHSCAAAGACHQVEYYDSGQFGDAFCEHCDARLLLGEAEQIKKGRKSPCCHGGDSQTEQMKAEYDELQNPPKILAKDLAGANDKEIREEFLNNTMPLNNTFAFASVKSEKAPDDQMGGRLDTCKYNGEFSFLFSDLIAPQGRRPTFAQVYTLSPEVALKLREENVTDALGRTIKHLIMLKMEALMRENPFGKTFQTAGKRVEQAKEDHGGEMPHFQIVLLTDRDLQCDALKRRGDVTVIERADAPTAKQVAVIWVQEDGLAPKVSGFWVCDKAGKMRELKSGMPQLDPCCFPLLHPRGTLGYRWFMKKRGRGEMPALPAEVVMEQQLDDARAFEMEDHQNYEADDDNEDADIEEEEVEMPEPSCDLDEDEPEAEEQGRDEMVAAHDNVMEPDLDSTPKKGTATRDHISERDFYRYRMAMRMDSRGAFHWLWFARRLAEFFVVSVLNRIERNEMDHLKKIQEQKNYRQILARDYIDAMEKGLKKQYGNARLGKVFLMPQTFAGSRQYYQKKYADLMTMVRHLGNPTWFVTFTGNPQWPEIQSALQGRQSYTQRPDIVCRIFMDKATEFVKDLTQRNVLGKVAGWCYSVEHQKRGMPHIHMLLIMDKQGRITTPDEVDEFVCARVPALPSMDDDSTQAVQQRRLWSNVTGMMMHDCNKACMEKRFNRRRGEEEDICKKNFPKPYSDRTELSEVRYTNYVRLPPEGDETDEAVAPNSEEQDLPDHLLPENDPERDWNEVRYMRLPKKGRVPARAYESCSQTFQKKRRGGVIEVMDDSRVIPYNPFLLLKYGCHINIEYVFGQKACKYIFKYLLKGFEKAYVQVVQPRRGGRRRANGNQEEVYDYDEIAATFKVRYMTAMEAYLRLHSYKIVSMSHQIYTLSVHDEMGHTIVIEEGHEEQGRHKLDANTRLTAFFQLCVDDPEAQNLTYDRIPYYYSWNQPKRMWIKRRTPLVEDPSKAKMFVRVYTVSPKRFELYAIRALLLNRPGPTSFPDLRTIDGRKFDTFTDAATHLGLPESDALHAGAMLDACAEKSNLKQLQHYFAMLLAHARPSDPQKMFDDFLDEMNPPVASNDPKIQPKSNERRRGEVMRNLEYFFRCMGTSCSDIGLHGLPDDFNMDQQTEILEEGGLLDDFFGDDRARKRTPHEVVRGQLKQLNEDQREAFDLISNSIMGRGDKRLFFVEGAGGCGKTFLYNLLIRWCLAGKLAEEHQDEQGRPSLKSGSVIAAASTGIAALLLIGGGTVHRLFSVPNDVDDDVPPKTSAESAGAKKLREAELIIIDEISMLSNKVLRYVDRTLRDVCGTVEPFGGKVVVLGGDWRQLAPVVEHGTREDQVLESIKMDSLFCDFQKLSLKINMRTGRDELELREWLHQIGSGRHQAEPGRKQGRANNMLPIPEKLVLKDIKEAIDFCFPPELFVDPMRNADAIAHNAVLCPTNLDVQAINDLAMERMCGQAGAFFFC